MCCHSREQFSRAEGLDQVIVGSMLQAFDPRFFTGSGGEENHRNSFRSRIGPQLTQQSKPVQAPRGVHLQPSKPDPGRTGVNFAGRGVTKEGKVNMYLSYTHKVK